MKTGACWRLGGQGNRLFLEASHSPNSDKFDVGRRGRRGPPPPHGFPANSFPPETEESATDRLPSSVVAAPLHDQGQGHSGLRPKSGEKGACRVAKTALSSLAGGGRASKVKKSGGGGKHDRGVLCEEKKAANFARKWKEGFLASSDMEHGTQRWKSLYRRELFHSAIFYPCQHLKGFFERQ